MWVLTQIVIRLVTRLILLIERLADVVATRHTSLGFHW